MYPTHPLIVAVQQDAGALELSAGFNQCPVAGFDVSPTTAKVDQPFDVVGRASDPDGDGGVLTFAWTASSGSFDQATASQTVFRCGDPGPVTLTLTVSDGSCDTPTSASIFCLGTHQDGGADALGGPSGSGGAGGRGGSGGTPGAGGDNGSGAGGQPGSGGVSGTGGRGIVNGCPAAEPAGNASSDGGGSSACEQCTTDNCSLLSAPQGGTDGCCGLDSVTDQLLCEALVACYSNNGCTNAGDPTGCFCGNNPVTCFMFAGQANGPCVAPVVAAAKTSDPSEIKIQFTRPTSALGRATNLTSCRGSFCPAECGIN